MGRCECLRSIWATVPDACWTNNACESRNTASRYGLNMAPIPKTRRVRTGDPTIGRIRVDGPLGDPPTTHVPYLDRLAYRTTLAIRILWVRYWHGRRKKARRCVLHPGARQELCTTSTIKLCIGDERQFTGIVGPPEDTPDRIRRVQHIRRSVYNMRRGIRPREIPHLCCTIRHGNNAIDDMYLDCVIESTTDDPTVFRLCRGVVRALARDRGAAPVQGQDGPCMR